MTQRPCPTSRTGATHANLGQAGRNAGLTSGIAETNQGTSSPNSVCPGDSAHTATLLTNGLCRRDKRRARAARSHISSPKNNTSAGAAGSRESQKPRIMGTFQGFEGAC